MIRTRANTHVRTISKMKTSVTKRYFEWARAAISHADTPRLDLDADARLRRAAASARQAGESCASARRHSATASVHPEIVDARFGYIVHLYRPSLTITMA